MNEPSLAAKASTGAKGSSIGRVKIAQMIVDPMLPPVRLGAQDFAGIEQVLRVEGRLDLAHQIEQFVAQLLRHEFGARDADAVLGRERSFELPDQRRRLVGKLPEFFQIVRAVQIEHRPHVQQSRRGVTVIGGLQAERAHDCLQAST